MRIARYRNTRYWAVIDTEDTLVCLCVYRKGALEVVRRLEERTTAYNREAGPAGSACFSLPFIEMELSSWIPRRNASAT